MTRRARIIQTLWVGLLGGVAAPNAAARRFWTSERLWRVVAPNNAEFGSYMQGGSYRYTSHEVVGASVINNEWKMLYDSACGLASNNR